MEMLGVRDQLLEAWPRLGLRLIQGHGGFLGEAPVVSHGSEAHCHSRCIGC